MLAYVDDAFPRPLTTVERGALEALLSGDMPGAESLVNRLDHLEVIGVCRCGCPSIYFVGSGGETGIQIASEAAVTDSMDSVLLFTTATGELASLEYVWYAESPPAEFPTADRLGPLRH